MTGILREERHGSNLSRLSYGWRIQRHARRNFPATDDAPLHKL
jgi:hypothetical protein